MIHLRITVRGGCVRPQANSCPRPAPTCPSPACDICNEPRGGCPRYRHGLIRHSPARGCGMRPPARHLRGHGAALAWPWRGGGRCSRGSCPHATGWGGACREGSRRDPAVWCCRAHRSHEFCLFTMHRSEDGRARVAAFQHHAAPPASHGKGLGPGFSSGIQHASPNVRLNQRLASTLG
jgi:hypothetical protein